MDRNAVHNALLNTLTMRTAFPRVRPRTDPCFDLSTFVVSKWTRIHGVKTTSSCLQ